MQELALNSVSLINQGQFKISKSTNPSGMTLNRRGRLARSLVVLSLAVVLTSLFGFKAGAGTEDQVGAPTSYLEITVAQGDTLWSLASRLAEESDPRDLVDQITSINSLASSQLQAGQTLRIPLT